MFFKCTTQLKNVYKNIYNIYILLYKVTLSEELSSIVRTRNVAGHDMHQKNCLHREVCASLHPKNRLPDNYRPPTRHINIIII